MRLTTAAAALGPVEGGSSSSGQNQERDSDEAKRLREADEEMKKLRKELEEQKTMLNAINSSRQAEVTERIRHSKGMAILACALQSDWHKAEEIYVKADGNVDLKVKDDSGMTILHHAARHVCLYTL